MIRLLTQCPVRLLSLPLIPAAAAACAGGAPPPAPTPLPDTVVVVDTVEVEGSNAEVESLEQRVARLQLQLLERDAQIVDLQQQLDGAIQEVVRVMARLQTLASRAEAASAIAEAEIALEGLRATSASAPEVSQVEHWLSLSTEQFNEENYGGSLYLATQARGIARDGQGRLAGGQTGEQQPGETLFSLPLQLETLRRSNVRTGPGLGHPIAFTLEPATALVGYAYTDQWVRVQDPEGRTGWIYHTLVGSRPSR